MLLAAQQFKEADQETRRLMLWVMSREQEDCLLEQDIEQFPCRDLCTIDQLWINHSNGRFGFSVQKRIDNEVGKDYTSFAECVGWRVNGDWLPYEDYKFELRALQGHFPSAVDTRVGWAWTFDFLMPRLADCKPQRLLGFLKKH